MSLLKLEKLARREKLWLFAALLSLLAVLLDQVVVQSVVTSFRMLDEATERAEKKLFFNELVLQEYADVSAEYGRLGGLLGVASSSAEENDRMTGEIVDLARETGLSCPEMGSRDPRKQEFLEEFTTEISKYEGITTNLFSFLHEVEAAPGLMRVKKWTLIPDKNSNLLRGAMIINKVMVSKASMPETEAAARE